MSDTTLKFPFDNDSRKTTGRKTTTVVHDRQGRIVFQVMRVNLPRNPDESIGCWKQREESATVARTAALVRLLNAAYGMVRPGELMEQQCFPGFQNPERKKPE